MDFDFVNFSSNLTITDKNEILKIQEFRKKIRNEEYPNNEIKFEESEKDKLDLEKMNFSNSLNKQDISISKSILNINLKLEIINILAFFNII